MPGCKPPCVEEMYGSHDPYDVTLCRRKWNYVENLYHPGYKIDLNGDRVECYASEIVAGTCTARATDDPARLADENRWGDAFDADYAAWTDSLNLPGPITKTTPFEEWLQWKYKYGTQAYGNLSQYKKSEHVGHCWMPCPYSTDSSDDRSEGILDFVPTKNDHDIYYMETASNGTVWGFRCTYDNCPYLTTYSGTNRYFYA